MKLVINAASTKMGGAVSYLTELLRNFSAAASASNFLVFLPPETAALLQDAGPNVELLTTQVGHAGTLRRLWWEQVTLRRFLKWQKADALFSTANFAMFRCPARQLLLITNPLYSSRIYRERFLPRHSLRYRLAFALRRWLVERSVRTTDVVMTPTRAMLDDLHGHAEVKSAVVNPFGINPPEEPQLTQTAGTDTSHVEGGRVVRLLYVSLYSEHKNLGTLLKAMAILNARSETRYKLKTTADPAWPGAAWTVTQQEDIRLARKPGIAEHVEFTGILGREATLGLYGNSDIFVFPSLAESFGFPMAEAMSCGLPVLAADTPVNREICGKAAVYFDPLSAEDLARSVHRLAADSALCRRLAARGREEAAVRFRWSVHAGRILELAVAPSPDTCRAYSSSPVTP